MARSGLGKAFVEVGRGVATAANIMARGKERHSVRDGQAGFQSHHARIASYHGILPVPHLPQRPRAGPADLRVRQLSHALPLH